MLHKGMTNKAEKSRIRRNALATGLFLLLLGAKPANAGIADGVIGNLGSTSGASGVGQLGNLDTSSLGNIGGFSGGQLSDIGGFGSGLGNLGSGSGGLGNIGGGLGNIGGGLGNLGSGSGGLGNIGGGLGNIGGGLGNLGSGSGGLGNIGGGLGNIGGGLGNIGGGLGNIGGGLGNIGGGLGNIGGNTGNSILGSIQGRIAGYLSIFQGYFQSRLSNVLGGLFGNLLGKHGGGEDQPGGGGMPDVAGVLGIPDSDATQAVIQEQIDGTAEQGFPTKNPQQTDAFNHNPVALTRSLLFEADRVTAKGVSSSAIGKEGQTAMQQQLEAVGQLQQGISAADQQAQGMDVTQDVMKQLAQMVDGSSNIQTSLYAQAEMARVQAAANGIVQSNISEGIDEVNRSRHAEALSGASAVLIGGANFYMPGMKKK